MEGNEIEKEILAEGEKKPPSEVVVAVSQPCRFGLDPNQRRLGFGFGENREREKLMFNLRGNR